MSTRCLIGRMNLDGSITAVYCHHDGYPLNPGVGDTLVHHYNSSDKVNGHLKIDELLKKGAMSSLGDTIEECDFYNDIDDNNEAEQYQFKNLEEYSTEFSDHDYHYYFNLAGVWRMIKNPWNSEAKATDCDLEDYIIKHTDAND